MTITRGFAVLLMMLAVSASARAFDEALIEGYYTAVDLSHAYNGETIYWPTAPYEFEKESL
ncbi:MAG: cyclase family protein, partial [Gammaproteobacteria bacterium]